MVDVDTFLTTLYVMVDDFCKTSLPPADSSWACRHPQPERDGDPGHLRAVAGLWQ